LVRIRDRGEDSGLDVSGCVARLDVVANGGEAPASVEVAAPVVQAPVAVQNSEEEPDYSNMSDAEVEAEIERLLAQKQAEAVAKRSAAAEPVVTSSVEPDYANMSDSEVEAEIERLLLEKQAQDAAKRAQKNSTTPSPEPVVPSAPAVIPEPVAQPKTEVAPVAKVTPAASTTPTTPRRS